MYELILLATGSVMVGGAIFVYVRTRDALHPAIIFLPLGAYVYSVWPLILNMHGRVEALFGPEQILYVAWLYLAGVLCLYAGLIKLPKASEAESARSHRQPGRLIFSLRLSPSVRGRIFKLALVLGILALVAYFHMLGNAGGFVAAYSQAKGGGYSTSGYIGEAVLLSFPAIILLAMSRSGRKLRPSDVVLSLIIALPHLLQGTLGGRRGPLFLILMTLFLGWLVARGGKPTLKRMLVSVLCIGLVVIVVQSQRRYVFLGSEAQFDRARILETITSVGAVEHNDYVAGVATVLTVKFFDDYYWGWRYFVTIFIRPIPKQIWPTKYEDVGADWVVRFQAEESGFEYLEAVGFLPPAGSAAGFLADIYNEFAWGMLLVVYLFGRFLGLLWWRHVMNGGLSTVIFVEAMILGVYLPTQSFSAWFHRFLFMAVITVLIWRYWVGPDKPGAGLAHRSVRTG